MSLSDEGLGVVVRHGATAAIRTMAEELLALRAEAARAGAWNVLTEEDLKAWSWAFLGGRVNVLAARQGQIHIADVARGLATHYRFNGATIDPYTVAEHSVIVSLYVDPRFARQALLHDAAEAYLGDMTRPLKNLPCMQPFRDIEARLAAVIFERFGVTPTVESTAAVQRVDDRILVDEISQLIANADPEPVRAKYGPALDVKITCLPWRHAEHVFVSRFLELFPEHR